MKALKRLFQFLVLLPFGIAFVSLAVANRHAVPLVLDPFSPENPAFSMTLPLFVIVFLALLSGILIGGVMAWLKQGRHRKAARSNRYEAKKWRNEADRQQQRVEKLNEQVKTAGPALPAPDSKTAA
ncbi:MAG: LapA family protein [Cohaesibacter sp.]|nr:LapA family protein [Cohaesibacter sp.]MCV6600262.1 LapA family protein [Cohaesibacter sp.]